MGDSRIRMLGRSRRRSGGEEEAGGGGNARVLFKAVVIQCIQDPFSWDANDRLSADIRISNQQFMSTVPRNSLIVWPISEGAAKTSSQMIAYPFFPPHICMPVKPGEQVWLIGEKAGDLGTLPFWIARCPEPLEVDDVNYTHGDRKNIVATSLTTSEVLEAQTDEAGVVVPTFPNGDNTNSGESLPSQGLQLQEGQTAYDHWFAIDDWHNKIIFDPVPRLSKRPGDLVLQGSNNTAIILGTDRGWTYQDRDALSSRSVAAEGEFNRQSSEYLGDLMPAEGAGLTNFNGTIDIVVGRGRFMPEKTTTESSKGDDAELTSVRTIENIRGNTEADKNPQINDLTQLPHTEGDPDFATDSARLYVSMKTSADINFGIDTQNENMATPFGAEIEDIVEEPFVVAMSDNVRIIARKDEEKEINGTIRIVKQGSVDDDLACIVLQPDGSIQISGSKIYLGRVSGDFPNETIGFPATDGGRGEGPDGSGDIEATDKMAQPFIRYQQLEDLINKLCDEIVSFCNTVNTHTTPGYGHPSEQINAAADALRSGAEGVRGMIPNLASERIFGE